MSQSWSLFLHQLPIPSSRLGILPHPPTCLILTLGSTLSHCATIISGEGIENSENEEPTMTLAFAPRYVEPSSPQNNGPCVTLDAKIFHAIKRFKCNLKFEIHLISPLA